MIVRSECVYFMSRGSLLAVPQRNLWSGGRLRNLFLAPLLFLAAPPGFAQPALTAADYICALGCRQTDANPRLEIEGTVARCWNEIGGLYVGEYHPPYSISCFHKSGRILGDGARIEWSDGVLWRRK
jgi:hypothetical protein